MSFVTVEKNDKSAPSEADMKKAMTDSGGTPGAVTGDNASRTLTYTGTVNHTVYPEQPDHDCQGQTKQLELRLGRRQGGQPGSLRSRWGGRTAALLFQLARPALDTPSLRTCYLPDPYRVHTPPDCNAKILRRTALCA